MIPAGSNTATSVMMIPIAETILTKAACSQTLTYVTAIPAVVSYGACRPSPLLVTIPITCGMPSRIVTIICQLCMPPSHVCPMGRPPIPPICMGGYRLCMHPYGPSSQPCGMPSRIVSVLPIRYLYLYVCLHHMYGEEGRRCSWLGLLFKVRLRLRVRARGRTKSYP